MRIFGALLLVVVLAVAVVTLLQTRQTKESFDAVTTMADELRESDIRGQILDPHRAEALVDSLAELLEQPRLISGHVEDLRTIAATAARWADAAPTPSLELRAAVAIRGAADDLRSYASGGSELALQRAERQLRTARAALAGELPRGSATDAIRDRLDNLGRAHQEKLQELDETLQ